MKMQGIVLGTALNNPVLDQHRPTRDTIPCPPPVFDRDEMFDIEFVEHFAELMTSLFDCDEDEIPTINRSLEIIAA